MVPLMCVSQVSSGVRTGGNVLRGVWFVMDALIAMMAQMRLAVQRSLLQHPKLRPWSAVWVLDCARMGESVSCTAMFVMERWTVRMDQMNRTVVVSWFLTVVPLWSVSRFRKRPKCLTVFIKWHDVPKMGSRTELPLAVHGQQCDKGYTMFL